MRINLYFLTLSAFRSVRFKNDWEVNFVGQKYNLRIGRSQFAFWINMVPVFDIGPGRLHIA